MQSSETQFLRIFESEKYRGQLELSDAKLQTDDGCNFDVHREILAKSNEYFRTMFEGWGEKRRNFHIPGISGACLSDILCYIYTGDIEITDRNIVDLILGADYLLVEDLQESIREDYIEDILNEVNCSRLLLAAHQATDEYIFRKCFRFIQTRFEESMKDDLVHFPVDVLERILSNRSLYVYNETTVWNIIVAWTQKDIQLRMSSVPRLLLTLATEDMGEQLATEILQHEIISQNCFIKDLAEIASSNDSFNNVGMLLTILRSCSNRFTKPILRHRAPPQLFVTWSKYKGEQGLYISYDENVDVWTLLIEMPDAKPGALFAIGHSEMSSQPDALFEIEHTEMNSKPDALLAIGHNIYIFNYFSDERCKKFDLRAMEWVSMKSFRRRHSFDHYCVLGTDSYIYLLGEARRVDKHEVQVYNIVNNRWRQGVPLCDISQFRAVAIEKKIYVVGNSKISKRMMMQMFDPDYQQWSTISPPTVHYPLFTMVAYHQKIYLIGRSDAEVFDPSANLWKKLPSAFDGVKVPRAFEAIVISDKIIVCDKYNDENEVRWDKTMECWENSDLNYAFRKYFLTSSYRGGYLFCTVEDVETIRIITKQNREPGTLMDYLSE